MFVLVTIILTFGTAHWKTKSVIGEGVELVAFKVMAIREGFIGFGVRWKEKTTIRPFFSKAVMFGISPEKKVLTNKYVHIPVQISTE